MTNNGEREEVTRKPVAIILDKSGSAKSSKKTKIEQTSTRSKRKTDNKKPRKPKTVQPTSPLIPVPDIAAQRINKNSVSDQTIAESLDVPPPVSVRKWSIFSIFFCCLAALISLAIGLWVDQLIQELFARQEWLGWFAAIITAVLVLIAAIIVIKEFIGLSRMARIENIRIEAQKACDQDSISLSKSVVANLLKLYAKRPDTARGRAKVSEHLDQIIDGGSLLKLAERDLLKPLDDQAKQLVMGSARRVSVVTAVSPRAVVDIAYVLLENTRLIRAIANLYGGQPGTLGFWRLTRNILGHLAITGTIAISENLLHQVVGQGLAAKISSKLGEGVVNGLLTTRIGIAAIDVCRPLAFTDQTRPSVGDFLSELTSFSQKNT